ncbi:hypothetical protein, partial [Tepidimonas charontis]|uniref:hypothetical protein n=1 Tax=Tepidimonas charontis TaxID=2267262 RepID=UPI001F1E58F4
TLSRSISRSLISMRLSTQPSASRPTSGHFYFAGSGHYYLASTPVDSLLTDAGPQGRLVGFVLSGAKVNL